ncbi:hypothetical protein MMC20_000444 [Loxospora ochrophaea]|nr:hypothetical protein [Loxospora ochrophaea]
MDKRQTQLRMAIIGLGRRSLNRGLKEIVKNESFELVAACDPSQDAIAKFQEIIPDIPCFESLDELLKYSKQDNSRCRLDCAYVAVPHAEYSTIIPKLLEAGIHVLKEKRAGTTVAELHHIQQLAFENGVRLLTAAQTRHGPYINQLRTWLPFIGTLYTIEGTRKIDVSNMGEGWRAKIQLARGGVLNDLRWHLLDTVLWLSGTALEPDVAFVTLCNTRGYQGYDCEDTAHLIVELQSFGKEQAQTKQPIVCNLKISRVAPNDTDEIVLNGSDGILLAREDEIELQTMPASRKISQRFKCTKAENFKYLLDFFAKELATDAASEQYKKHRIQDKLTTMLIHDVYAKSASKTSLLQDRGLLAHDHYVPPKITEDVVDSVSAQMKESLSIYDDSGVLREFEVLFKEKHNRLEWYSLLHNSGSNALQALYYAAGLIPGDEVIHLQHHIYC